MATGAEELPHPGGGGQLGTAPHQRREPHERGRPHADNGQEISVSARK